MKCAVVAAFLAAALAAQSGYELSGEVPGEVEGAAVSIFGATTPFTESTMSDSKGRFRFRKLPAGTYTIAIFITGKGEARRTVEIGPASADSDGRVKVTVNPADFAPDDVARRESISTRELAISERARSEFAKARKSLGRRDVDDAVAHLTRAVELSPQFAAAWNTLGTIAYQGHEFERAEGFFRRALAEDPRSYEALVNLGGALVSENKPSEALGYNQRAVLERPADALANAQLGLTWFELGRLDPAEKYLDRARRIDPAHFSHPQLVLAEIHRQQGRPDQAAADLEDFLRHHPDWPQAEKIREAITELHANEARP